MLPNLKNFTPLLLLLLVLSSCEESKNTGPQLVIEPKSFHEINDYHENYLKEISFIKTRKDSFSTEGMTKIDGGIYWMGGNNKQARRDEYPRHKERIKDLWVDQTEVTNLQFRKFVEATGYVTTAERSFEIRGKKYEPGSLVFDPKKPKFWWKFVKGANWKHPEGPESSIIGKDNFPVVQVSWYDAMAYAKWAGKRLPTEAEYEYLNRGGKAGEVYNWGDDFETATQNTNFYQGRFPINPTVEDGFAKLAPAKSFKPNGYGLYDTAGNVWEWCLDTYHADAYSRTRERTNGYFEDFKDIKDQKKVLRGGSFLCSENYCTGYRNAARMSSAPDSGLEHTGFRCVKDIKKS